MGKDICQAGKCAQSLLAVETEHGSPFTVRPQAWLGSPRDSKLLVLVFRGEGGNTGTGHKETLRSGEPCSHRGPLIGGIVHKSRSTAIHWPEWRSCFRCARRDDDLKPSQTFLWLFHAAMFNSMMAGSPSVYGTTSPLQGSNPVFLEVLQWHWQASCSKSMLNGFGSQAVSMHILISGDSR